jgi:bacillithiol biosynthesis deacetylase BshB1
MRADILAFAAHPDDVELAACGTLMKHNDLGKTTGIVDLTEGQLGSRGTPELRLEESLKATEILGVNFRENLGMEDGWFRNDKAHILPIAHMIRKYQPQVVLANAIRDRHPDHGRASQLVSEAAFYSGLVMVKTGEETLGPWRPRFVLHYIQDRAIDPDIVVDISDYMDRKMAAIQAFGSQFFNPESKEPQTPISSKEFLETIKGRAREMGRLIGTEFGEGFVKERALGVDDLTSLR